MSTIHCFSLTSQQLQYIRQLVIIQYIAAIPRSITRDQTIIRRLVFMWANRRTVNPLINGFQMQLTLNE